MREACQHPSLLRQAPDVGLIRPVPRPLKGRPPVVVFLPRNCTSTVRQMVNAAADAPAVACCLDKQRRWVWRVPSAHSCTNRRTFASNSAARFCSCATASSGTPGKPPTITRPGTSQLLEGVGPAMLASAIGRVERGRHRRCSSRGEQSTRLATSMSGVVGRAQRRLDQIRLADRRPGNLVCLHFRPTWPEDAFAGRCAQPASLPGWPPAGSSFYPRPLPFGQCFRGAPQLFGLTFQEYTEVLKPRRARRGLAAPA